MTARPIHSLRVALGGAQSAAVVVIIWSRSMGRRFSHSMTATHRMRCCPGCADGHSIPKLCSFHRRRWANRLVGSNLIRKHPAQLAAFSSDKPEALIELGRCATCTWDRSELCACDGGVALRLRAAEERCTTQRAQSRRVCDRSMVRSEVALEFSCTCLG